MKQIRLGRSRWALTIGLILLAGLTIAWLQFSPGVTSYSPDSAVVLTGKLRSSAEHDSVYSKSSFPYVLDIRAKKGRLLFVGVQHTNDPNDPQLVAIKSLWQDMQPDVALVEGRIRGYFGNLDNVASRGEPYLVFALARRSGTVIYSLEPDPVVEGAALAKAESPERALMFITLRGYISDRNAGPVSDADIEKLLHKRGKEYRLASSLSTVRDIDSMWATSFPGSSNWRTMDEKMLWPGEEKTFLNHLANVANEVRDEHWARTMVDLVRKGKKVFAVGGASHTIILEPVLKETLKD